MNHPIIAAMMCLGLTACDLALGLDDFYRASPMGPGGASAEGGGGSGGGGAEGGAGGDETCEATLAVGDECDDACACTSGHCSDGVCCDEACDGVCMGCGADGLCAPSPWGQVEAACGAGETCNGAGQCGWQHPITNAGSLMVEAVAATGELIVVAGVYDAEASFGGAVVLQSPADTDRDLFVLVLATDGTVLRAIPIAVANTSGDVIVGVDVLSNGDIVIAGNLTAGARIRFDATEVAAQSPDCFVATIDAFGVVKGILVGGQGTQEILSMALTSDDRLVIGGYFATNFDAPGPTCQIANAGSGQNGVVARIDLATFTCTDMATFVSSGPDIVTSVDVDSVGGVVVAGRVSTQDPGDPLIFVTTAVPTPSTGGNDGFVARIDAQFDLAWGQILGGIGEVDPQDVTIDGAGHLVLAGTYATTLFQTGTTTCTTPIDLVADTGSAADVFALRLDGTTGCYTGEGRSFPSLGITAAEPIPLIRVARGPGTSVVMASRISGITDAGGGNMGSTDRQHLLVLHYESLDVEPTAVVHPVDASDTLSLSTAAGDAYLGADFAGTLDVGVQLDAAGARDGFVAKYAF